jgi:hypothetical protein
MDNRAGSAFRRLFFVLVKTTSLKSGLKLLRSDGHELVLLINQAKIGTLNADQKAVFDELRPVSDFSFEGLRAEVEQVLAKRRERPEIRFVTNDESCLPLAGKLRDHFATGEASFSVVNRFKDKGLMKAALLAGDRSLEVPRYLVVDPAEYARDADHYAKKIGNSLSFPIFAKPVDSAASCFTQVLRDPRDLTAWLAAHGDRANFELDEFVSGELFHCDSLVKNGEVLFGKVSRYNVPCAEFLSGKPMGSITLADSSADAVLLTAYNAKVLKALSSVPDGAFHLEIFRRPSGELVFLEIAARTPGAFVPQTFLKAFGLSLEEAHLTLQMGMAAAGTCRPSKIGFSAWIWYPVKAGKVAELTQPRIGSEHEVDWKIKAGDLLGNPAELGDLAVGIKLWNDDFEQLNRDFAYLSGFSPFRVE